MSFFIRLLVRLELSGPEGEGRVEGKPQGLLMGMDMNGTTKRTLSLSYHLQAAKLSHPREEQNLI